MVKKFLLGLALWAYHLFEPFLFLLGIIVVLALVGIAAGLVRDNFFGGNERHQAELREQAQQEAADLEILSARQEEWPMLLQRGLGELAKNRGLSEIPKNSPEYLGFEVRFYETMALRSEPQLFDRCKSSLAEAKKATLGVFRQQWQSDANRAFERIKRRVPYGVPENIAAFKASASGGGSLGKLPEPVADARQQGAAYACSLTQPEAPRAADEPAPTVR